MEKTNQKNDRLINAKGEYAFRHLSADKKDKILAYFANFLNSVDFDYYAMFISEYGASLVTSDTPAYTEPFKVLEQLCILRKELAH